MSNGENPRSSPQRQEVALAVAAHPDDIEFMMAGTLALLEELGHQVHYLALANGSAGHLTLGPEPLALLRREESHSACQILGAVYHDALVNDAEIIYGIDLLRRLTSVVRAVKPTMIFTHAPEDYLADHTETSRLVATAAFNKGLPNFLSQPTVKSYLGNVAVYHALPHGLRDQLNRLIKAEVFVDISTVIERKRLAISAHQSQQDYLLETQRFTTLSEAMMRMSEDVGSKSRHFILAEGWRRHNPLGLSDNDFNPLLDILGERAILDPSYTASLG